MWKGMGVMGEVAEEEEAEALAADPGNRTLVLGAQIRGCIK